MLGTETEQIEVVETAAIGLAAPEQTSRFSVLARDVAAMGGGTALAAVFNTVLVFLIPRLVSVEDFGYWRLFLLYASYVALLHLGFADGLLLRWAGRPLGDFHDEIGLSMRFMFWQHLVFIVPAGLVVGLLLPPPLGLIGAAIFVLALIINLATVLQDALQGARQFKSVAIATAIPPGVFVTLAFISHVSHKASSREFIVLYCIAWVAVLIYFWARVRPGWHDRCKDSAWRFGKASITMGWPILLANGGLGLVQSADRLVVSSALPIYDFAQYSLASSMMFVPVTAIAAVYRVFFSHVAAVEHEDRARVYAHASRFLLLAWSLLLPYFFVLEVFVRRFLPRYSTSLPVAGILLLGVIFLAGIQILHMSFAYLYGRQQQFLFLTLGALALSVSIALVAAIWLRSLVAVAIGQVVALAIWWLVNEWKLRKITGQVWKDWLRMTGLIAWSLASYGIAMRCTYQPVWQVSIYYLLVFFVLLLACRDEFRIGWRLLGWSTANASQ